jgi:DNA-directed RNA polymerase specialized sigma subunit
MTDHEYAVHVCKMVLCMNDSDIPVDTGVILEAISMLTQQEQLALECYYRLKMSPEQTGHCIGGITGKKAEQIIFYAIHKLSVAMKK